MAPCHMIANQEFLLTQITLSDKIKDGNHRMMNIHVNKKLSLTPKISLQCMLISLLMTEYHYSHDNILNLSDWSILELRTYAFDSLHPGRFITSLHSWQFFGSVFLPSVCLGDTCMQGQMRKCPRSMENFFSVLGSAFARLYLLLWELLLIQTPYETQMKNRWKNYQLRKGALHPGLSSRDITEQLDPKEGGEGGGGGGLVTSSRATILHSQVTKKWWNYWPLISTMCLGDLCAAINSLGDPAVS